MVRKRSKRNGARESMKERKNWSERIDIEHQYLINGKERNDYLQRESTVAYLIKVSKEQEMKKLWK